MRFILISIILVVFEGSRLTAQVPTDIFPDFDRVYILSGDGLLDPIDYATPFYKTQLEEQFTPHGVDEIIRLGKVENWPANLNTSTRRFAHAHYITDYVAYYMGSVVDENEELISLLYIPKSENSNMQPGMQPVSDFIMPVYDFELSGEPFLDPADMLASDEEPVVQADGTTIEPGTPVEIIEPGALFSTYDLTTDPLAKELLAFYNDDPEFIKKVAKLANESSWPPGISSITNRNKRPSPLLTYNVYYYGQIGDRVILITDADENAAIADPQLKTDKPIVFIFGKHAFKIKE
jgi:hypothetical protein